tara:strand:+ start:328 stop:1338 length:1011 start_codon:yes stop_codon:yes gene_type:complete
MLKKTFIIAEAGINHNGDLNIAKKMIKTAKKCGVDAIKFQSYESESLVTKNLSLAKYQKKGEKKNYKMINMLKKYELSKNDQIKLCKYCKKLKIIFMSSAFDMRSLSFLIKNLNLKILKIPSGEITNLPYLIFAAKSKKKIILSTGMSNMKEIKEAVTVLIKNGLPKKNLKILHCNTAYPTPHENVNLNVIKKLKSFFKVDVGYSDHTKDIEISLAAVAIGAQVIEKHFTLNKKWFGPDHASSLDPNELTNLVKFIRNIEIAKGSFVKKITTSEKQNIFFSRKSLVALRNIKKGEKFTELNMTVKRPGKGISPMNWFNVINKQSKKNFKKDDLIKL